MKIIGHRGAAGLAPENTLAAIEAALAVGVDEIEIDVRVTADGVPIACHDPRVGALVVAEHTFEELRKVKPDLATLASIVKRVDQQVPLMLEVKPGVSTVEVVSVVNNFLRGKWKASDFSFASFSQQTLIELHKALPSVPTVVIQRYWSWPAIRRAKQLGTRRINMNRFNLWWGFILSMSRAGYQLNAYTLNSPRVAKYWAKFGLAGILTDYPNRVRANSPKA